jgi:hypothetical protein
MKLFLGSVLALAIAGSPLLARQEPQDDKDKPRQEEPKAKPKPEDNDKAKPKQEPQPKPDDKAKPRQEPQRKPEEKQQQKTDKERQKPDERQQPDANRPAQQRQNAPQAQAGHERGQRIPEERYRAAFGKEHRFHVRHAEPRFQYGGYWFEVVQPWPAAWVADDDCYLEEDGDEYFLVDMLHPDLRVEVIVVRG